MLGRARFAPVAALVALACAFTIRRCRAPHHATEALPQADSPTLAPLVPPLAITSQGLIDAKIAVGAHMLHGDAHHTHRARGIARAMSPAWSRDVGGAVEAQIVTSVDEQTLYVATLGGKLIALARDGSPRWSVDLGDRVYGTPLVGDDGTIYLGSDAKSFFAIHPNGVVAWKLELDDEADTSAVQIGRRIVFGAGRTLYAVTPAGTVIWRFSAGKKIFSSPALTDSGLAVFGSQDAHAYGVDANGKRVFCTDLGADVDSSPAIDDSGAIYFGTDGGDIARLNERGEIAWKTHVGGFVRGALSIARSGDVVAGTYGPAPRVVRLSPSGVIVGSMAIQGTGAAEFGVHGGPLEDDAHGLFFGAQDDAIHGVHADGSVSRFETGGDVDGPITLLSDGTLVFGSDDGKVTALH